MLRPPASPSGNFPLTLLCLGALLASSTRAAAHAPPQVARIVWKSDAELLLVTNRGLMFGVASADGARHDFRLLCNEALRINTTELPQVAYRQDGALLAATSNGLFLTRDEGCSFEPMPPLTDMLVPALAQSPTAPDTLYAATFAPGQSALRSSHDGGKRWETLRALDDRDYTRSLRVAPGDANVLYASGTVFADPPSPRETHYIARSSDGGKSWQRHTVALEEGELALLLLAVNPANADELLVRAMSASPGFVSERLFWSGDGGQHVSAPLRLLGFDAATFATDGSAAWVATREGMFRAGAVRDSFTRWGAADYLSCADFHAGQLWTCGHYAGNDPGRDGVARAAPNADIFTPVLDFRDVARPVICPASSTVNNVCAAPWRDFHDEVVRPFEDDAGVSNADAALSDAEPAPPQQDAALPVETGSPPPERPDAGSVDANAEAGPRRSHGSRCGVAHAQQRSRIQLLGFALLAFALRQRRDRGGQVGMGSRADRRIQPRTMR